MKNRDLAGAQNLRLRCVLLFLSYCFATSNLWAQVDDGTAAQLRVDALNVIPPSPAAQQFQVYGNIPVNNAVGVPSIEIPIHTLSVDGVNVPISLSYHASGIRVNELATDVGLKWTLNAGGMVYRSINGHEDETAGFFDVNPFYFSREMWSGACSDNVQSSLLEVSESMHDLTPDNFGYTIPGHSGSFFYNKERKLHQTMSSSVEIIWTDKLNFLIRDDKGVEYHFGGVGYLEETGTETKNMGGGIDGSRTGTGLTGWKLRKIVTRNGKVIDFYYKNYSLRYGFVTGHSSKSYDSNGDCDVCISNKITSNFGSYTQYDYDTQLLESIVSDNAIIKFNHELDASLDKWQQKLTSIDILYKDNTPLQKVKFEYISSGGKLILKKMFWDAAGSAVYNFDYVGRGTLLPPVGSFSQDIFGFNNGATNTSHMIPVDPLFAHQFKWGSGADRSVNEANITYGVLNEIQYPTGGKTKFYYQANKEGEEYAPGLRVSALEDYDIDGALLRKTKYEYSGLSGEKRTKGGYTRNFKSEPRDCAYFIFSSNEISNSDRPYNGYYYQKVVIRNVDKNDRVESVIEENYVSYLDDHTFKPYLSRRKLFTNGNRLVQEKHLEYVSKENPEVVGAISAGSTYTSHYPCGTTWPGQCLTYYDGLAPQKYRSFNIHLLKETNTEKFEDGSLVTTVNNYKYNDFHQLTLKEYYNTTVPGEIHKQEYKYPTDYSRSISLIDQLCSKNMTSLLVDYRQYTANSVVKNGAVLMYDGKGNVTSKYSLAPDVTSWSPNTIVPTVGSKLEQQGIWSASVNGQLDQTVDAAGINTAYLWSYNNNYLVAVAVNATKEQILYYSFEEDGTTTHGAKAGNKSLDASTTGKVISRPSAAGNYLISYFIKDGVEWEYKQDPFSTSTITLKGIIDEVKVYPVGALMSTYTYKPGVGVSSVTDGNGQTTYYEYDVQGRLLYIRDDAGNILQKYDYKYFQGAN